MREDKMNAADQSGATVIRGAGHEERIGVRGRYFAVATGPTEDRRDEYVALRDEMLAAETAGNATLAAYLRSRLDAIPTEEKWRDEIENLVTTVGKNDILDKYLKGSAYTQTIVMGLKGAGTAAAGDTQASHAGWTERGLANAPAYTGNRKAVTMGSASSGSSVSPTQAFAMTSSGTVDGCFINNGGSATKDDTTGVLFSAGDFSGGSKAVTNGDTVNVTYTLSV